MRYAVLLCIAVTAALFAGCFKSESNTDVQPSLPADSAIVLKDQAYGDDSQQRMDVYLPAGRTATTTRCIVFIHGGAWAGGDKEEFNSTIDSLRRLNSPYAFFNINYRLASIGKNQYPAAEQDVQNAVGYIQQNLQRFQVSNATVLVGTSAGAHLAALQAYKHNEEGVIKAAVCLYGVYDLSALITQTEPAVQALLTTFMGGLPAQKEQAYHDASPVNYVTAQGPPALVMYGTEDEIAPPAQAQQFVQKLQASGVAHEEVSYRGGHGIPPANAADAWTKVWAFIGQ